MKDKEISYSFSKKKITTRAVNYVQNLKYEQILSHSIYIKAVIHQRFIPSFTYRDGSIKEAIKICIQSQGNVAIDHHWVWSDLQLL